MRFIGFLKDFALRGNIKRVNAPRRLAAGFGLIILIGALLLMLPVSARGGERTPFAVCLFTSVSCTCVTGLTLVDTYTHWSVFGQAVMLMLIQIGGLGFITIFSIVFLVSRRQIGMRERIMMTQSMSIDSMEGIVGIVKRTLYITAGFELAGAVMLALRFVPLVGFWQGIWFALFHSVSAFCNAGFDLMGRFAQNSSMIAASGDPLVLGTLMVLIVSGGLGFFVWSDIFKKRTFAELRLHSKLVLIATPLLIAAGAVLFFALEHNNPASIGRMSFGDKLLNSLFESVTTRTAGFAAVDQRMLREPTKLVLVLFMMIGGASGSTAGGIKVVTAAVVAASMLSVLKSRTKLVLFARHISRKQIILAFGITAMAALLITAGGIAIAAADGVGVVDAMYEAASAYGTVGLTSGVARQGMSAAAYFILVTYMFFGRVGIMTVTVSFVLHPGRKDTLQYPSGNIFIG